MTIVDYSYVALFLKSKYAEDNMLRILGSWEDIQKKGLLGHLRVGSLSIMYGGRSICEEENNRG